MQQMLLVSKKTLKYQISSTDKFLSANLQNAYQDLS